MRVSVVGIPWYKREDYDKLLSLFADRKNFPATYENWLNRAERVAENFRSKGQAFQKVYIDPETFPSWCSARGLDIDSNARMRFANEVVAGVDQDR